MVQILKSIVEYFGFPSSREKNYAHPERLADVIALIQVLALDKHTHRSEDGLNRELQGKPKSAESWTILANEHPEFFRVKPSGKNRTSLVARHVLPENDKGIRELSDDLISNLLKSAIDIHDRQVRRMERWTYLIPIWVALIAGVCTILTSMIKACFS